MIKTITINSKTVGTGYQTLILKALGFGSPKVANAGYAKAGQHGFVVPNSFWRERRIIFDLLVRASTRAGFRTERNAVIKAFGLPRVGLSTLQFETTDGLTLQTDVQLVSLNAPFENANDTAGLLTVELITNSPYFNGQSETETTLVLASGFGTAIPTVVPLSLAYTSGGRQTVNITGNGVYYPTITIYGPVTNPIIKNYTTNKLVQTEVVMTGSDILVIDMSAQTVVLNSNYNYLGYVTSDSEFWSLDPGNNEIGLSSSTYDANAQAVMAWRNSYLGI